MCIAMVAVFWGGWPLVARSSGHGGALGALIISSFSLIPIAATAWFQGDTRVPDASVLVKLALAGAMVGGGMVAFNYVANSKIDASVSIPIIDAAMLVVSIIGAAYFFQEAITVQKVIGVGLLLAGIAVIRPG